MIADIQTLTADIQKEFPSFRLVPKADSRLMRTLDILLRVFTLGLVTSFMTEYITTLGTTVYTQSGWDAMSGIDQCVCLRHERIHMRQAKKYSTPLFYLLYLFAPLPLFFAYFRLKFEEEAYAEEMRAEKEYEVTDFRNPVSCATLKGVMEDTLSGPSYCWAWVSKKSIGRWFMTVVQELSAGESPCEKK